MLGGTASTRKCASQLWPATGVARRQRWLLQLCSRALPHDERVAALEAEVADLRAQLYSGGPAAQQAGGRKLSLRKEEWDLLPARIILLRWGDGAAAAALAAAQHTVCTSPHCHHAARIAGMLRAWATWTSRLTAPCPITLCHSRRRGCSRRVTWACACVRPWTTSGAAANCLS